MEISSLFAELLQVSIGKINKLSCNPSSHEWGQLFEMAVKQAVAGVVFNSFNKLYKQGQTPPSEIFFEWLGHSEQVKQQNRLLNQRCVEITEHFRKKDGNAVYLKVRGTR